jgi:hypothetical protein
MSDADAAYPAINRALDVLRSRLSIPGKGPATHPHTIPIRRVNEQVDPELRSILEDIQQSSVKIRNIKPQHQQQQHQQQQREREQRRVEEEPSMEMDSLDRGSSFYRGQGSFSTGTGMGIEHSSCRDAETETETAAPCKVRSALQRLAEKRVAAAASGSILCRRRRRGMPPAIWLLTLHTQLSAYYNTFLQRKYLHLLRAAAVAVAQLRGEGVAGAGVAGGAGGAGVRQTRTHSTRATQLIQIIQLWEPSRLQRAIPSTTRSRCIARLGLLPLAKLYDRWRVQRTALSQWLAFLCRMHSPVDTKQACSTHTPEQL